MIKDSYEKNFTKVVLTGGRLVRLPQGDQVRLPQGEQSLCKHSAVQSVHTLDQLDSDLDLDRSFAVALGRCDGDLQTNILSDTERQSDCLP